MKGYLEAKKKGKGVAKSEEPLPGKSDLVEANFAKVFPKETLQLFEPEAFLSEHLPSFLSSPQRVSADGK